jgi:hypothetical protein
MLAFQGDYINCRVFLENNYFENIENLNSDMPMIWLQAQYVRMKNTTIINSKLTNALRLFSWDAEVSEFYIYNCTGLSSKNNYVLTL